MLKNFAFLVGRGLFLKDSFPRETAPNAKDHLLYLYREAFPKLGKL